MESRSRLEVKPELSLQRPAATLLLDATEVVVTRNRHSRNLATHGIVRLRMVQNVLSIESYLNALRFGHPEGLSESCVEPIAAQSDEGVLPERSTLAGLR